MKKLSQTSLETDCVAVAVRQRTRWTSISSAKREILRYSGRKLAPHYIQDEYMQIIGQILSHLRDAVRLVHSKERDADLSHHIHEALIIKPKVRR